MKKMSEFPLPKQDTNVCHTFMKKTINMSFNKNIIVCYTFMKQTINMRYTCTGCFKCNGLFVCYDY